MNYSECYGFVTDENGEVIGRATPKQGDIVLITINSVSHDSGRTWRKEKTVRLIDNDESFRGTKTESGPSYSEMGKTQSGHFETYCSRFDGKRWRSMRSK
ncbi:hypothetical protein LCGC14_2187210 [marine sediment metagenome]|uniref:Uncharacterized protein n=1 Tax=marine sediment metagenome TaxID=412755 RepID=A0A0F9FXZ9_9ZZZZ